MNLIQPREMSENMQELANHPEQRAWLEKVQQLTETQIFTGRLRLRKVFMKAQPLFDLNLLATPPNNVAR